MNKLKLILRYNYIFLIILVFLIIYVLIFTQFITYKSKYSITDNYIEGKVISYSINGNSLKMDVKGKETVKASYYIKSEEEKNYLTSNLLLGTNIKLRGSMEEPLNNTIPNTFNYKNYLYNKKIFYLFKIDSYELDDNNNLLYKLKDFMLKRIYNSEENDYLLIFLMGDKSLVSNEEYTDFQVNGTAHLLAVSGMHIGLLVAIFNIFFKRLSVKKRFVLISLFLLLFGFLTSFSSSVSRVILFFVLNNLNKILEKNYNNIQILYFTCAILIFFNPFIVYDYGFLYSSIITWGILYYSKYITGNYFSKLFKLSLISFIFSLPITASLNYEINLLSVFTNLVFVPLVVFVIYPLALFTCVIANPLWNIVITLFIKLNSYISELSVMINIPKLPWYFILLFYILLIFFRDNKKWLITIALVLALNKIIYKLDDNYYVYFLDVGQGDSSVLISPYQKEVIMIDTGGKIDYEKKDWQISNKKYNISDNTIKFLKSIGIKAIDYLILTHGDFDHMGEAINLVNNFKVKIVIFNGGPYNNLENELIKVLDKKKINYYSIVSELNIDENKLYFLQTKEYDNENDNSNVIYTELNNYKFLFMGDASSNTEKEILDKYNFPDIDVLKVGHHGSNTSSSKEFIYEINPKYSIISVGKNNTYGHPKKEVLEHLKDSKIYRTDQDGSIMFKIKNNELKIETCTP